MEVGLYIYTESYEDTTELTALNFRSRVLADSGVFEGFQCCVDDVEALGGTMGNVTSAKRIDTFDDEKIQVTSTLQNVNDIAKIFTDYSQSFSVPASRNNNEIFGYWYENANDNGFDQRTRYNGYIEIDSQVFRIGRWQIESAEIKDGQVNNYKLTFYGLLRSLLDTFGEDKLIDLTDINQYSFAYTGNNVRSRIQTEGDVIYPLISSERVWQYGGGGNLDISQNSHAININELFPAIRVARLFDAIEAKYGVNFQGNFLSDPRFTKLYLWLKNANNLSLFTSIEDVDLSNATTPKPTGSRWTIDTTNNTITNDGLVAGNLWNKLTVDISVSNPSIEWEIFVYKDGVLFSQVTGIDSQMDVLLFEQLSIQQNQSLTGVYNFKVQTNAPDTVALLFTAETRVNATTAVANQCDGDATVTNNFNLSNLAPDMKVADFFSGILKMLNLTCFSYDEVNYKVEQLENWYANGQIKDITEYVTTDLTFERFKTYKEINFKYQKSESFINRQFADTFKREHGDLQQKFTNDGSEYKIELPFEKLQYNRLSGNLHCAYALTNPPDFKPYIPKPVVFYAFGNVSCPTFYVSGSTAVALSNYCLTGDFINFSSQAHTNNWGNEQILGTTNFALNSIATNSLFFNYYSRYLNNLYSLKSRIVKCKAVFSLPFLNALQLNDRLIIRDKRYTINQMTTDLNTGEVDLELIQDFREVQPLTIQTIIVPPTGGTIKVPIEDPTEIIIVGTDADGMVISITPLDGLVEVELKSNTLGREAVVVLDGNKGSEITIIIEP